ncbi:unnamed protein product [Durusdinium trenchii]|uniref:Uncharacterized protein n=1 Tax=Durusdinium trenchii TaxID=1381693 RepID=A0ABP0HTK0_9DINO
MARSLLAGLSLPASASSVFGARERQLSAPAFSARAPARAGALQFPRRAPSLCSTRIRTVHGEKMTGSMSGEADWSEVRGLCGICGLAVWCKAKVVDGNPIFGVASRRPIDAHAEILWAIR